MNREKFNLHVEEVIDRTKKILLKKGEEYAKTEDVFHNFNKATGISLQNTNVAVGWEFCVKHLQSIKDIITDIEETGNIEKLNFNLIDEKFGDAINYFILLEGMIKEKIKNK